MEFIFLVKNLEVILLISVPLKILMFLGFDMKPDLSTSPVLFFFSLVTF